MKNSIQSNALHSQKHYSGIVVKSNVRWIDGVVKGVVKGDIFVNSVIVDSESSDPPLPLPSPAIPLSPPSFKTFFSFPNSSTTGHTLNALCSRSWASNRRKVGEEAICFKVVPF